MEETLSTATANDARELIISKIRVLLKQRPDFASYIEMLLEDLLPLDIDDETATQAIKLFQFCRANPRLALLLSGVTFITRDSRTSSRRSKAKN